MEGTCDEDNQCRYAHVDLPCDTPPGSHCVDSSTLRVYSAQGTCDDDGCSYQQSDEPCSFGCELGSCLDCSPESDPHLCEQLSKDCGTVDTVDGCGVNRTLHCGTCTSPETCGGSGAPNVCGQHQTEVLYEDSLANAANCHGDMQGGAYVNGGWQTTAWGNRIIYDLHTGRDCGTVEFDVTNFNPTQQFGMGGKIGEEPIVWIASVWEGTHGDHWAAHDNFETMVWLQVSCHPCHVPPFPDDFRDHAMLLNSSSVGWHDIGCPANLRHYDFTSPISWSTDHVYRVKLRWNYAGPSIRVFFDGQERSAWAEFCWGDTGNTPNLRYVFLGQPHTSTNGFLNGPIYSNVRITTSCDE